MERGGGLGELGAVFEGGMKGLLGHGVELLTTQESPLCIEGFTDSLGMSSKGGAP